ncbi:MAG: hypothetical protein WCC36_06880 [Gammaproteobacteria bacterium]
MKTTSLACAVTGALLLLNGTANAAEWFATPKVSARAGYNDNLTITTQPHSSVRELDVSPEVSFGRKTETSGITGQARIDARRYWGQSGLNTNDRLLNLHMYDNAERMGWTLDGNITKNTTLQSELNDTGLVLQRTPRLSRSLSPGWNYLISQKTQLKLGYRYQDVRYPDQATLVYQDYRINAGTATLSHQYTQRLQLFATGSVTYYRTTKNQLPARGEFDAHYDTVQAGASYAFSQTLNATLSAGLRRSTTTINTQNPVYATTPFGPIFLGYGSPVDVTQTGSGSVLNASLQKQLQTGTLSANLSRNVQPTGYGGLVETDRLDLSGNHRLSVTFSESLDLSLYRTKAISSTATNLDRTFVRVEPALAWNMTRWWRLQGSYRYARQRYTNQSETATQNAVYVTLAYTWPKIAVSR